MIKSHSRRHQTNSNLLILFHGLGDNSSNFIEFGSKLELPQTSRLSVNAPLLLAFTSPEENMNSWAHSFDLQTGDLLPTSDRVFKESFINSLQLLKNWFLSNETTKSHPPERIFLMGYGQGAQVALEFSLLMATSTDPIKFGGVVSICGLLDPNLATCTDLQFSTANVPDILITASEQMHTNTSLIKYTKERLGSALDQIYVVPGKARDSMPSTRSEMEVIMAFVAKRLYIRNLALEAMADRVVSMEKL